MQRKVLVLLVIDGLGLCGAVVFSVLYALQPDKAIFLIGQIISVVIILITAIVIQQQRQNSS
jgi:hypothetical protein